MADKDKYLAFKESLYGDFKERFDRQSTVLKQNLPSDAYNANRALCFEWYLSGFLDGAESGIEVGPASDEQAASA